MLVLPTLLSPEENCPSYTEASNKSIEMSRVVSSTKAIFGRQTTRSLKQNGSPCSTQIQTRGRKDNKTSIWTIQGFHLPDFGTLK